MRWSAVRYSGSPQPEKRTGAATARRCGPMHQPRMLQADQVQLTAEGHRRVAMQLAGS